MLQKPMLARQSKMQMHTSSEDFLSVWKQTCEGEKCPSQT